MNREMFDAVEPYLATAQDVRDGHGAQGEPATGTHSRPVETPISHPVVDPGALAPSIPCVGVGDVAAHLPPGSTTRRVAVGQWLGTECQIRAMTYLKTRGWKATDTTGANYYQRGPGYGDWGPSFVDGLLTTDQPEPNVRRRSRTPWPDPPPSPGSTNDVGSEEQTPVASRPRPSQSAAVPTRPSDPTNYTQQLANDPEFVAEHEAFSEQVEAGNVGPGLTADEFARQYLPAIARQEIDRTRQSASLTSLHKALELLVTDADRLAENGDLFSLADGLEQLRRFRQATADVERHIEDHVAGLMTANEMALGDDEITLERHSGARWKNWDWDGILRELGAGRWIDPETGETVVGTLREVVPLTGSVSPRVQALRDRGIDRDEFAERHPGRRTVTVRVRGDRL